MATILVFWLVLFFVVIIVGCAIYVLYVKWRARRYKRLKLERILGRTGRKKPNTSKIAATTDGEPLQFHPKNELEMIQQNLGVDILTRDQQDEEWDLDSQRTDGQNVMMSANGTTLQPLEYNKEQHGYSILQMNDRKMLENFIAFNHMVERQEDIFPILEKFEKFMSTKGHSIADGQSSVAIGPGNAISILS